MIDKISSIVRIVGFEIMQIYDANDFEIQIKNDDSPLTKADIVSNKIISAGLRQISDYPVVSEETNVDYAVRKKWRKFWLVDPLDGTKDFIAKNGQFTVNIALIEDNQPILGLIYIPALDTIYWAECGKGAYKDQNKIYNTSNRMDLIAADSIFHSTEATIKFLKQNGITQIKRYGSSLKYCKLAEGEIDIYPRFNGTKEWDTAAGQIILEEAGCKIIDLFTKKSLIYNKPNIKNDFFLAFRNDLEYLLW
jgi:3'(2'), 5'-bisphosphate nucleotidase